MDARPVPAILILELVGERGGSLGRDSRKVFKSASGTIGCAQDSTWVLPEPRVSFTHARIDFANNAFTLTDTSSHGIQMGGTGETLKPGVPHLIRNRTRFLIGDFEIQATLLDEDGLPLSANP